MRELEASLQAFGAAPHVVRWVRRFLSRHATDEPLADQVRRFCEGLERNNVADWQVRQAEQALRLYFLNFLERTDWHRAPTNTVIDADGRTNLFGALEEMRQRLRTPITRTERSAPTSTGRGASWRMSPSSRTLRNGHSSTRQRFAVT
jgi:hypothetical protein